MYLPVFDPLLGASWMVNNWNLDYQAMEKKENEIKDLQEYHQKHIIVSEDIYV